MSDTIALPSSPLASRLPGDLIAGKYRLERELGRGAMGTVWAAVHATLGQRVAIKLIAGEQSRSAEARQRFSVEAKAAARLRSRHVVQVYDDGETPDGTPYIVMEYLEGETLEQRLERDEDMGLPEAVRITTHVGRALARAHAQSVVHRDLKSGNIFIAKSDDDELGWVAKVLDFGVAKVLTEVHGPSTTKTGTIVGTPLFMSPEQIRGASHVDHRADLYSLGMVFYNMVTRAHAFDGPSYSDVLVAICTESLPDIRVAAPWLPPSLSAWFDKACARERERRFQSADEMIEALQDACGPASRLSRPSLPDEISGPSGTLVGHVPPHTAATLMADAVGLAPSGTPAHAPSSIGREAQAIAGATAAPRAGTVRMSESRVAPRRALPNDWLLWAATGVALACGTMALAVVLGRTAPSASRPAPGPSSPATAETLVTSPPAKTEAALSPPPSPPAATEAAPAAPPLPAPPRRDAATSERRTTTPAATSRVGPPRHTAAATARATSAAVPHLHATAAPEKPTVPRSTPVSTSTPDMGF